MQEKMADLLKKLNIKYCESERKKRQKPHHSKSYILTMQTKSSLLRFFRKITPLLVVKQAEAEILLSYLEKACLIKCYFSTPEDLLMVETVKKLKRES